MVVEGLSGKERQDHDFADDAIDGEIDILIGLVGEREAVPFAGCQEAVGCGRGFIEYVGEYLEGAFAGAGAAKRFVVCYFYLRVGKFCRIESEAGIVKEAPEIERVY
ncbi:hypothetical protein ES705_48716 [subsurface metagenome]